MTPEEWREIAATPQAKSVPISLDTSDPKWVVMKAAPCPLYDRLMKACTVYEQRPYSCRRYQCGRWNAQAEPYLSNPMVLIKSNNDLRWSYAKNQKAHQPWALAHGWRAE